MIHLNYIRFEERRQIVTELHFGGDLNVRAAAKFDFCYKKNTEGLVICVIGVLRAYDLRKLK